MYLSIISYTVLMLVLLSIGWLIASYQHAKDRAKQLSEREEIVAELRAAKQKITLSEDWRKQCELLNKELRNLGAINSSLEADLREATTRLESTQMNAEDKIHQIMNNEKRLSEHFENLANRIFKQNNRQIDEQNRQSLNGLLAPLREQLESFRHQLQDSFSQESRERHTLTHEIHNLQKLNAKITQETANLTHALKGNNKIQGNWGETILSSVLESSGLREGHEYEMQVSVETNTHSRMKPDVIIHLPRGKDVIVDAKMTLIAYERYFNAEDKDTRELALQEHVASIRNHIRQLGRKDYHQLPGLNTLDYILMFIPIEPAFLLALEKQPELITEALQNNIILVSPTTLLVALRTIANLWRYEHQNHNAQKISKRASQLYDKMRLFVDDLSSIGQNLDRAQDSYRQAIKKMVSGRGNLLAQAEAFHSLGVEIKRKISPELTKQAVSQDDDYHCHNSNDKSDFIN